MSRRPFLGVFFECCSVYRRVYLNRRTRSYRGRCPRCLRSVSFVIGPHGTRARFFRAR